MMCLYSETETESEMHKLQYTERWEQKGTFSEEGYVWTELLTGSAKLW